MKELSPLELFDDVVAKIAATVSREYPGIDSDDISQELYLTILTHRTRFKDPDADGVTQALWTVAKRYARQLRTEGLHVSPQYGYLPEDIRRILEHTFCREEWPDTGVPEDAVSRKPASDSLDLQSDVSWAWEQLTLEEQRIIFEKYALRDDFTATQRKRLSRAIERMVEILNTYRRPAPARRAIGNTHAQHIIGGSYE